MAKLDEGYQKRSGPGRPPRRKEQSAGHQGGKKSQSRRDNPQTQRKQTDEKRRRLGPPQRGVGGEERRQGGGSCRRRAEVPAMNKSKSGRQGVTERPRRAAGRSVGEQMYAKIRGEGEGIAERGRPASGPCEAEHDGQGEAQEQKG